ncbi:hypothetical protein [Chondromyces crocatus]|uniref:Lipoprotein n=1 Tax=Chondromyces crocatus TaxID=52 RepID=A0A0K1EH24_CHOCO|nr:hypothetical protein [Chondromyces crocatus]AKT40161.1 uncharacterized protein CMC5_043140 [Chondromyces crocatus]
MRFSWLYLPLVAAVAVVGPACSVQGDDDARGTLPTDGVPGPDATLSFNEEGTLELAPGEERTVHVTASPPAKYEISFSIVGDASGAWLDRTKAVADAAGRASVKLHAPSLATTFRLRAAVKDGPSTDLGIAVSDKGFAPLLITPVYAGQRQAEEWTATVKAGMTCAEIASSLPEGPEGGLVATTPAADAATLTIKGAPVGPNLAVAVRAGRAMWGCSDIPDLEAGKERAVSVTIKDGPLDLGATRLDLSLAFTPNAPLSALAQTTASRILDVFLPVDHEGTALLDAMAALMTPDQQLAFADHRTSAGWDDAATEHLHDLPTPLRDTCRTWIEAGLATLTPEITAHLSGIGNLPGKAWLQVTQLGGVPAQDAGVPLTAHQASWTSEPGDVLRLDGKIYWVPSRYVGAAAQRGALESHPQTTTMGDALALAAACEPLATALGGFIGCNTTCLAALCTDALEARWAHGVEASTLGALTGTISLSASGASVVNQDATPVRWNAAWLGRISDGAIEATVQGQATATESGAPPG